MLNLRRGLLAAGIAVSVAAAVGVASMISANADQLGGAEGAAAGQTAAPVPPAQLPWGARPSKIRTGRAGATTDQLRAGGEAAAPADTSGATQPSGRYGPKGRTGPTLLKSEKTDVKPPQAPTTLAATANYFYAIGSQTADSDGFFVNASIARPTLDSADYHTLAEIAVQSADGKQVVEVGWTVDKALNGDTDPHLFVFHWVNDESTCYNGCGWVQYSKNVKPGDTLATGAKRFGVQYASGAWWVSFDSEFIGYFPDSLWSSAGTTFTKAGLVQVFGEVASTTTKPCSDMGNGALGTDKTAAAMGSGSYINGLLSLDLNVRPYPVTDYYNTNKLSTRSFQYGGPGAC